MSSFKAAVPSNIALIKYWGKRSKAPDETQWPANDSLSMTLSVAETVTTAALLDGPADTVTIDGASAAPSGKAIVHLSYLRRTLGFDAPLRIDSHNSFPKDCGVASSASGLAGLTVAALAAWTGSGSLTELARGGFDRHRLASLARQGSGSACRSLFGGYVRWSAGDSPDAQSVESILDPGVFDLADLIVLLSRDKKPVSSTEAHAAAWSSPLFKPRLAGLAERQALVERALEERDFTRLGEAIETEALEMHAVMMTATPPTTYLLPETGEFIAWLRTKRRQGAFEAYVTLDAGPNPHVLVRPDAAESVRWAIREEFGAKDVIFDVTGAGPKLTLDRGWTLP